VADADGTSNIYRAVLSSGEIFKVTDVSTGVSGVSALSPALTVAQQSNQLAFSVYRHGAFEIQLMDATAGMRVEPAPAIAEIASTERERSSPPSGPQTAGAVIAPTIGLQDGSQFTSKPYRAALSFNRAVQPYLSAQGGGTGSTFRGGVSLSFGDMLGDQQVDTALQ